MVLVNEVLSEYATRMANFKKEFATGFRLRGFAFM